MSILFISDVHLCAKKPVITNGFISFLRNCAVKAKSLYILGDLFKLWIGDDDLNEFHYKIALALQKLSNYGISCYFINGNKDFLLGKNYAKFCKMKILPTYQIIKLNNFKIIILHGDSLCTKDKSYQLFRSVTRMRFIKKIFLSLSLQSRQNIVRKIKSRIKSRKIHFKHKNFDIKDINTKLAISLMRKTQTNLMIHGHTHRPKIHVMKDKLFRIVLGSWNKLGTFLEIKDNVASLKYFKF